MSAQLATKATKPTGTRKPKSPKLPPNVHRIAGTDLLYTTSGDEVFSHQDAGKWAKALPKIDGYTKWDLAEKREAVLLIDDERYAPAVNTQLHPGIGSYWYWLKRPLASSSVFAWFADFGGGVVGCNGRGCRFRALAVCRPVSASQ